MRTKGHLTVIRDAADDYYWHTTAMNGNILAKSSEAYRRAIDMRAGLVTTTAIQYAALEPRERAEVLAYAAALDSSGDDDLTRPNGLEGVNGG